MQAGNILLETAECLRLCLLHEVNGKKKFQKYVDSCPLQDDSLTGLLGRCSISSPQNKSEGLASDLMDFLHVSPAADDAMSFTVHRLSLCHCDNLFLCFGTVRGTSLYSLV